MFGIKSSIGGKIIFQNVFMIINGYGEFWKKIQRTYEEPKGKGKEDALHTP